MCAVQVFLSNSGCQGSRNTAVLKLSLLSNRQRECEERCPPTPFGSRTKRDVCYGDCGSWKCRSGKVTRTIPPRRWEPVHLCVVGNAVSEQKVFPPSMESATYQIAGFHSPFRAQIGFPICLNVLPRQGINKVSRGSPAFRVIEPDQGTFRVLRIDGNV